MFTDLIHLQLWIKQRKNPRGENAGLNTNHNFFTPWASYDSGLCEQKEVIVL